MPDHYTHIIPFVNTLTFKRERKYFKIKSDFIYLLLYRELYINRKVITGAKIGTKKLFPTANFSPYHLKIPHGVYLCKRIVTTKEIWGVLHFGHKKTFNNKLSLEVHFLDFNKEIYGKRIKIYILNKMRDIQEFKTLNSLKIQIKNDIMKSKEIINLFAIKKL